MAFSDPGAWFRIVIAGLLSIQGLCIAATRARTINCERIATRDGLSQGHVYAVLQDSSGFMWFGTRDGLNRYDGFDFVVYRHDPDDPTSLSSNYVYDLHEDEQGRIWVATRGGGLARYDRETDSFQTFRHDPDDPHSISADSVYDITPDPRGYLWLGTRGGGLCRMSMREPGRFQRIPLRDRDGNPTEKVLKVLVDRRDRIWVGTQGNGLFILEDPGGDVATHYRHEPGRPDAVLGGSEIWTMLEDERGRIWLGGSPGWLHVIEPDRPEPVRRFLHDPEEPDSLSPGRVQGVFEDGDGQIWVGTMAGGLNLYQPREDGSAAFLHFTRDFGDPTSPSHDMIWTINQDRTGLIWVGTYGGGIYYFDPVGRGFVHYKPTSGTDGLPRGDITSFAEHADGRLWVGSKGGGLNLFDPRTGTFARVPIHIDGEPAIEAEQVISMWRGDRRLFVGTFEGGIYALDPEGGNEVVNYRHDPADPESLGHNEVRSLLEDRAGMLWAGTLNGGLNRMDPDRPGRFTRYGPGHPRLPVTDRAILSLLEDRVGNLWVGTWSSGLNRIAPDRADLEVFRHDPEDPDSLSNDLIWSLFEGRGGELWVGTGNGLNRLRADGGFEVFKERDGLPNRVVNGIQGDSLGLLWLSTNQGLAELDPETRQIRVYDVSDGLQADEFLHNAHFRAGDGALLFGGVNGFNRFFPEDIHENLRVPPVVITDFLLANNSMRPVHRDPDSPLRGAPDTAEEIVLSYKDRIISFEFAALDYAAPEKNRYSFMLEGFKDSWIDTSAAKRIATFTNLDPGTYTFRVRARTKDGPWNEDGPRVSLVVTPPYWRTPLAYVIYVLVTAGLIYGMVAMVRHRRRRDREALARMRQLDALKDDFLANTSHELRTPLNGIIGLAESLADGVAGPLPEAARANLDMIVSSGRRLASLVNDILDFAKLRNRNLELAVRPIDLHALCEVVVTLSRPLTTGKDLALENRVPVDLPPVSADENRLEQVMHNLIGNAIKFTPHGKVVIEAREHEGWVEVRVTDTGIGIPPDKLTRIFASFEQADASIARDHGGTGLGLAISRQLVALHGGTIWAESEVDKGTELIFTLPLSGEPSTVTHRDDRRVASVAPVTPKSGRSIPVEPVVVPDCPESSFRVLVVDDEPVNRQVLINHLTLRKYKITEAPGGREALDLVFGPRGFDLVILDVMMPRLSGYEVARQIRRSFDMRRLPIIFLTAKNQVTDLVAAFEAGGNDFLAKPIQKEELLARVQTHLELLDFHRRLEGRVEERTNELKTKNDALDARFRELETLEKIVRTINREVSFAKVIHAVLEQGVALFPKAERSIYMTYDKTGKCFEPVAAVGHDMTALEGLSLGERDVMSLADRVEEIEPGLYIASGIHAIPNVTPEEVPRSTLVMLIVLGGEVQGFMLLDNMNDPEAFDTSEVKTLARFREHVISAVSKAKVLEDLVHTQKRLMETAHLAGRAEIATDVLHTIGNILNSISTSLHMVRESVENRKSLDFFTKILSLLEAHKSDLTTFLSEDQRGRHLRESLDRVYGVLDRQRDELSNECGRLAEHVRNVEAVLKEQQRHTQLEGNLWEPVDLVETVVKALDGESRLFEEHGIEIVTELGEVSHVKSASVKLRRVLDFLIHNALDAVRQAHGSDGGRLIVRAWEDARGCFLELEDNGIGIAEDQLDRIFVHGFTTKPGSQGFGLHYCANAMTEMSGSIEVTSPGTGLGTTVRLGLNPTGSHGTVTHPPMQTVI